MAIKNTRLQQHPTVTTISEPLSTDSAIVNMFFCNLSENVEYINVHIVKSGESADDKNKVLNLIPIDPQNTFSFGADKLVLSAGDTVWASTTTTDQVSATISYVVM